MRTVCVVVRLVLGQNVPKLPLAEDQHSVQTLATDRTDPALGEGVALRCTRRATQHSDVGIGEYRVEACGEFRVAIADQEPESVGTLRQCEHEVAGLLGDPLSRRMPCHTEDVDPPCADLEDEEYIDPTQPHGVDGEEVARQHRGRLGTAELPPGWTHTPRCRLKPRLAQDVPHRRRSDSIAKSDEFAVDAAVTPRRVLPGEADHQSPDDGRSPGGDLRPVSPSTGRSNAVRPTAGANAAASPASRSSPARELSAASALTRPA